MKREQLSNRIGNIEDRLVEQAENAPNFGIQRRKQSIRRMVSIAAVLVLVVSSFTIGGIAMAKETIVYVEKEQEIIAIDNFGISVILPDDWAGKYGYEISGNNLAVYLLAQREDRESEWKDEGYLFFIDCLDEVYPMDYIYPEPGYTIATTSTNTYRLRRASDIQYDFRNPSIADEYVAMSNSVSNIQILLTDWLKDNSKNISNP